MRINKCDPPMHKIGADWDRISKYACGFCTHLNYCRPHAGEPERYHCEYGHDVEGEESLITYRCGKFVLRDDCPDRAPWESRVEWKVRKAWVGLSPVERAEWGSFAKFKLRYGLG